MIGEDFIDIAAFVGKRGIQRDSNGDATTTQEVKTEKAPEEAKEESEMEKAMKATLASMTVPLPAPVPAEPVEAVAEMPSEDNEQDLKKRQAERFRDLLRDKYNEGKISSTCNWEHAVKHIQGDPRFRILTKVSEKKQLFNAWKVQRQKEERLAQDEKRLAIKKAKEDLEKWLQDHPKMKPGLKYMRARDIFGKEAVWQAVHEDDRQDIFREALVDTTFEEFSKWVTSAEKGLVVDYGNMKLCYNSLVEKAESKEREAEREEARKKRRQESEFRHLLRALQPAIDANSEWATVRGKIEKEKAFLVKESDSDSEPKEKKKRKKHSREERDSDEEKGEYFQNDPENLENHANDPDLALLHEATMTGKEGTSLTPISSAVWLIDYHKF
ncbi:FF domain protein [Teladorsagia circumcincta]|uniref:FF domain protein n=1 Tax=Teladorsagia circumcincta TaxID=45464 RepID=A0A2G9TWR0_TELCI|nr:FF domain protein [Teladorsagia circumcincta]